MGALPPDWATWGIAALATAGVIIRPFAWPEWAWAASGAALLVLLGLLPAADALAGVRRGTDVYLFLAGMMMLAELAREAGLFDWLAARAAGLARGSATRLFTLVFIVATAVTVFLSKRRHCGRADARRRRHGQGRRRQATPLPYLFICAFVANAASFVLPISNPANLVIYGAHMPPLLQWLPRYALPSLASILATYAVLRWTQRDALRQDLSSDIQVPSLSAGGQGSRSRHRRHGRRAAGVVRLRDRVGAANPPGGAGDGNAGAAALRCPGPQRCCGASVGACCRWWPGCSC